MDRRDRLIEVFQDTEKWCRENERLKRAVQDSIAAAKVYEDGYCFSEATGGGDLDTEIVVESSRTFAAAQLLHKKYPDARIAVHNFASATNPGGGVRKGSTAQEECLCRCSTLYPVLAAGDSMKRFYLYHRERHDVRYTDTCIYTPDIWIIKTDTELPDRMPEADWCKVDVITCAAPNLRAKPYNAMNPGSGNAVKLTDRELLELHRKRARHMLHAAAENHADILVLGAFGCGAFQNKPEIVARAYKEILPEFRGRFRKIEFAVYCTSRDSRNYDVFKRVLQPGGR